MILEKRFVFPLLVYVILYALTVPFVLLSKPYLIPDVSSIIHKTIVIAIFLLLIFKYIKNNKRFFKLPQPSVRIVSLILALFALFAINNYGSLTIFAKNKKKVKLNKK